MDFLHARGKVHAVVRRGSDTDIRAGRQGPALVLDTGVLFVPLRLFDVVSDLAQSGNVPVLAVSELVKEQDGFRGDGAQFFPLGDPGVIIRLYLLLFALSRRFDRHFRFPA